MNSIDFSEQLLGMEKSLQKYAYRLTSDNAEARDLVQDTFLKAILNREKFIDKGFLKAWTFTIMRNTFINNYRHTTLQNTRCDRQDDSFQTIQTISSDSDSPDSAYSVIEINQKIDLLKDTFRVPFKMYIAGFRYKEIADRINLNLGTVKSRIFLARKILMNQLST
jgi:RNA polymerase sigma-70 factor, ECF subfamily